MFGTKSCIIIVVMLLCCTAFCLGHISLSTNSPAHLKFSNASAIEQDTTPIPEPVTIAIVASSVFAMIPSARFGRRIFC